MKKMLRKLIAPTFFALIFSVNAHAGIPTMTLLSDVLNELNQVFNYVEYVEQTKQLIEQVEKAQQMVQQGQQMINQAEQMYQSVNGIRSFGDLLSSTLVRSYLPKEAGQIANMYNGIANGQFSSYTGVMQGIKSARALINSSNLPGSLGATLDKRQTKAAAELAMANSGYDFATQRTDDLQSLLNAVNTTDDAKGAQDLANRIAAESVLQGNEILKNMTLQDVRRAEEEAAQQQEREQYSKFAKGTAILVQ